LGEHIDRTNIRISAADRAEVHALIAALKAKVQAEAPPEQREEATELVDELENAIVAEVPKVRRMAFIRDWFSAHLPKLAGAVSELVLSPLVGKIVGAAGDLAATEFRNTFGA
jgi:hypothetical protein